MTIPIPAFSRARVLVVGDVMLDRYWHGSCSRVSPEAPVPVVKVEANVERPGGAANVAVNIASLGGMARVLGVTGADEAAVMLERNLASLGVASDLIKLATRTTIVKLRVLSRHQQLLRLDFEDGFPDFDGAGLLALYHQRLA
ncbi:MAG: PfkB family carbohydrate kinase, partial [Gammaproteobacteria bacterium]